MKILYFHQHFSTPRGATGIRSYQMARRLVSSGHNVTMVCGSYKGGHTGLTIPFVDGMRRGFCDDIEVIEYDLAYSNAFGFFDRALVFLRYALRCIQLVISEPADLVFATTTPLTASIPGIAARLLTRKTFVFEVRDLWPELPKAMGVIRNPLLLFAMSALEWMSYRTAHRLVALAPGIAEGIARRGVNASCIAMIPNGCDLDIFTSSTGAWRPEGVKPNDIMAVFAGTHGVANGLDAVLDTASELKERGRLDIKFVLIGQGRLKPELQARVSRENLDSVIFLDPVDKARLAGLLAATDVGLQILANVPAFYFGTSPNKFFDYIAAGCPVLTNYPGWVADMIAKNKCGFAVRPEDPKAFAEALEVASADRAALADMGRRGRSLAEQEFARDLLAQRFVDWLESSHVRQQKGEA